MKGVLLGAVAGAGAMYLLDPVSGKERRRQALQMWSQNKNDVYETAGKAADTASKVTAGVAEKVTPASDKSKKKGADDPNTAAGGVDQHVVS